jgi:hypothetical protein
MRAPLLGLFLVLAGAGAAEVSLLEEAGFPAALSCEKNEDLAAKTQCCTEGLAKWLQEQPRYKAKEEAATALLLKPHDAKIQTEAAAAEEVYQASATKKTHDNGIRECVNSAKMYRLPADTETTTLRKEADTAHAAMAEAAKEQAVQYKAAARSGDLAMKKYALVSGGIGNLGSKVDTAAANLEAATTALDTANTAVTDAEDAVDNSAVAVASSESQVGPLEEILTDAEAALVKEQYDQTQELEDYDDAISSLNSTMVAKQGENDVAEKELADKEAELSALDVSDPTYGQVEGQRDTASITADTAAGSLADAIQAHDDKVGEKTKYETDSNAVIKTKQDAVDASSAAVDAAKLAYDTALQTDEDNKAALKEANDGADAALETHASAKLDSEAATDLATSGDVDKDVLQQEANEAAEVASQALAIREKLDAQADDAASVLEVTTSREEHAVSKVATQSKDPATTAWEGKYAAVAAQETTLSDSADKFENCIKDDKWIC